MKKEKPKFVPKPGQIDYTNVRRAPTINCVVKYRDKILLVQRSSDLHYYPDYWSGVTGFLDDDKTVEDKAREELREEVGIEEKDIVSIRVGGVLEQDAPQYDKTWIVHPVLVEVSTDKVTLDWEGQEYRWVAADEIKNLNCVPGFVEVVDVFE